MAASLQPEAPELGVDERLAALFQAASIALRERRRVIALGLWQPARVVSLLPFHAYLGRAPFCDLLPVHPKFGILSFRSEDDRLLDAPLYGPASSAIARIMESSPALLAELTEVPTVTAVDKKEDVFTIEPGRPEGIMTRKAARVISHGPLRLRLMAMISSKAASVMSTIGSPEP